MLIPIHNEARVPLVEHCDQSDPDNLWELHHIFVPPVLILHIPISGRYKSAAAFEQDIFEVVALIHSFILIQDNMINHVDNSISLRLVQDMNIGIQAQVTAGS